MSANHFSKPKLTRIDCHVLESDREIMWRLFDLFPQERGEELHSRIAPGDHWKRLFDYVDVDRLMRLHHRDWLARNAFPRRIVAEGWIYVKRRYRRQLYDALQNKVKDTHFRFCLVHYLPPKDVCVERHAKSVRNRHGPDHPHFAKSPEEQRLVAEMEYDKHVQEIFEAPNDELVRFKTIDDGDEVVQYLDDFFTATDA